MSKYNYNEPLKEEILKEIKRISESYKIRDKWVWEDAENFHQQLYNILVMMIQFPISVEKKDE